MGDNIYMIGVDELKDDSSNEAFEVPFAAFER